MAHKKNERDATQIIDSNIEAMAKSYQRTTAGAMRMTLKPVFDAMDVEMAASSMHIACKAGCAFCCHYRVQVSAAEAFALAEHVEAMPAAQQAALREQIATTAKRVAPLSKAEYEATNIACAFLEGSRCSVYALRPSPCRGHHAVDAGVCERTFQNPASTEMNALDPARHAAHEGYKSTILFGQHHAGHDGTAYELHTAVHAALTNRAGFRRWKDGKVAFPEVRDRQSVEDLIAESLR